MKCDAFLIWLAFFRVLTHDTNVTLRLSTHSICVATPSVRESVELSRIFEIEQKKSFLSTSIFNWRRLPYIRRFYYLYYFLRRCHILPVMRISYARTWLFLKFTTKEVLMNPIACVTIPLKNGTKKLRPKESNNLHTQCE